MIEIDVTHDEPGTHPCKDCALGKYNEATQSVSIDACLDCAKGKYAPVVGTTTCTNCEPGRYQNSIGQSNCINCILVNMQEHMVG